MPVFGLMLLVYSDESLEELKNPSEDESPKLSFESLSCSLELQEVAKRLRHSVQISPLLPKPLFQAVHKRGCNAPSLLLPSVLIGQLFQDPRTQFFATVTDRPFAGK